MRFNWRTIIKYAATQLYDFKTRDFTVNPLYHDPESHMDCRVKISRDGKYLFVTVDNGVQFIGLNVRGNKK